MADDSSDISKTAQALADLASKAANYDKILKSLEGHNKSWSTMDPREIVKVQKLTDMVKRHKVASEELAKVNEEIRAQKAKELPLTDAQIKKYDELTHEIQKYENVATNAIKSVTEAEAEKKRVLKESEDQVLSLWKKHTMLGKTYNAATSNIAQMAAGLGLAAMAWKAFQRVAEAANTRMDIMIQSFKSIDDASNKLGALDGIRKFESSLRSTQAAAQILGMEAGAVGGHFKKFAEITGTQNPQALEILTKSAMVAAKTLNIDTSEAIEFTKISMDKFGGSAADALDHLMSMRKEIEVSNSKFVNARVRGDDLTRTLMDLSKSTDMYALDQRYMGDVLKDNQQRLQASGESYDAARRKADKFIKATTSEAPEWMKIVSGQNITNGMVSIFQGIDPKKEQQEFMDKYGEALEKAKPGLAKKVADVAKDKSLNPYDRTRIIQELTAGTEVGQTAMAGVLLDTFNKAGKNFSVIAQQFGVSYNDAVDMVKQAQQQVGAGELKQKAAAMSLVEVNEKYRNLLKEQYGDLANNVSITKEQHERLKTEPGLMDQIMKKNQEDLSVALEKENISKRNAAAKERMAAMDAKILAAQQALNKSAKGTAEYETNEAYLKELESQKARLSSEMKATEKGVKAADVIPDQLISLNAKADEMLKQFIPTSLATGGYLKSIMTALSNPAGLIGMGLLITYLQTKFTNGLADKIGLAVAKAMGDKGDNGGSGPDLDLGGKGKGKKARRAGSAERLKRMKSKRGFWGKTKGLLGKAGGAAKGMMGGISGLAQTAMGGMKSGVGGLAEKVIEGGGGKLLKAMKIGKAIPILGSLVSAGFLAKDIWNIGSKIVGGEGIKASDFAQLGLNAAGLIPGLGTVAAAADIGLSATGAYDALDKSVGPVGALAGSASPSAIAAATPGSPGGLGAMASMAPSMAAKVGAMDQSGQTLTLTIDNWVPMIAKAMEMMKTAPRAG